MASRAKELAARRRPWRGHSGRSRPDVKVARAVLRSPLDELATVDSTDRSVVAEAEAMLADLEQRARATIKRRAAHWASSRPAAVLDGETVGPRVPEGARDCTTALFAPASAFCLGEITRRDTLRVL